MLVQRRIKLEDNSRLQIRSLTTKKPLLWLASQPDEEDHYRRLLNKPNKSPRPINDRIGNLKPFKIGRAHV